MSRSESGSSSKSKSSEKSRTRAGGEGGSTAGAGSAPWEQVEQGGRGPRGTCAHGRHSLQSRRRCGPAGLPCQHRARRRPRKSPRSPSCSNRHNHMFLRGSAGWVTPRHAHGGAMLSCWRGEKGQKRGGDAEEKQSRDRQEGAKRGLSRGRGSGSWEGAGLSTLQISARTVRNCRMFVPLR